MPTPRLWRWKTGRRTTGLVFSAVQFAQKFGLAIGAAFRLHSALYGFVANQDQTEDALLEIRLMFTIFPAVLSILAPLPFGFIAIADTRGRGTGISRKAFGDLLPEWLRGGSHNHRSAAGSLHELRICETPLCYTFQFKDLLAFWRKTVFCPGGVFYSEQALKSYLRSEYTKRKNPRDPSSVCLALRAHRLTPASTQPIGRQVPNKPLGQVAVANRTLRTLSGSCNDVVIRSS